MSTANPPSEEGADGPASPDESDGDPMAPPRVSCECSCIHCRRVFPSDQIWFQRVVGDPSGFKGYWMCPTPNCDGAGFAFDIFPTDPDNPANADWHSDDDEEDGESEDGWDPTESKYQEMDEDEEDDDLEGEEWKLGLDPGERPEPEWLMEARRKEAERQKQFEEPDRRPREVEWIPRESQGPAGFNADDIPF